MRKLHGFDALRLSDSHIDGQEAVEMVEHDHIPLSRASLCMNCQSIYRASQPTCPGCGSREGWPVAKWIEREDRAGGASG